MNNKNRFFLSILFLFGLLYLNQKNSIEIESLKVRVENLNQIVQFTKTGNIPKTKNDIDLNFYNLPLVFCGGEGANSITIEIDPIKSIKFWYGINGLTRRKNKQDPDEEWPYMLKDNQIQIENEFLDGAYIFRDESIVYLAGSGLFLSNSRCPPQ